MTASAATLVGSSGFTAHGLDAAVLHQRGSWIDETIQIVHKAINQINHHFCPINSNKEATGGGVGTLPHGLKYSTAFGEAGRAAGEENPEEGAETRDGEHQDGNQTPQQKRHQLHLSSLAVEINNLAMIWIVVLHKGEFVKLLRVVLYNNLINLLHPLAASHSEIKD